MPLPVGFQFNNQFQQGDLTGLVSRGRCFVTNAWPSAHGGADVLAHHGSHFAVIDDFTAVAANGKRIGSAHSPEKPANTKAFGFDEIRNWTHGSDEAWLDLEGLTLADGEGLRFWWKFISDDDDPYNDFALFLAFEDHQRKRSRWGGQDQPLRRPISPVPRPARRRRLERRNLAAARRLFRHRALAREQWHTAAEGQQSVA